MHHETAYKIASELIAQIPKSADTIRWTQNLYQEIILALHHFYPETPDDEPETEKVDMSPEGLCFGSHPIVLDLIFDNILNNLINLRNRLI